MLLQVLVLAGRPRGARPAPQPTPPNLAPGPPFAWLPLQDVVHLDAFGKRGELVYCLGHEVRSLHHPGYMRPLYNRRDY